jgi:hypothetical protein
MFRTYHLHLWRLKSKSSKKPTRSRFQTLHPASRSCCLLHVVFLFDLLLHPQDAGNMFLQNVSWLSLDYTVLCSRRQKIFISSTARTSNPTCNSKLSILIFLHTAFTSHLKHLVSFANYYYYCTIVYLQLLNTSLNNSINQLLYLNFCTHMKHH